MEVAYLKAKCGVRYWEDATVNGEIDEDGSRIPCREGDYWSPLIDLRTGAIVNWPEGVTADIHYKVCDDGEYGLCDANGKVVHAVDGYVPSIMSPGDNGYGDYVIMTIGPDGKIADWKVDFAGFGLPD